MYRRWKKEVGSPDCAKMLLITKTGKVVFQGTLRLHDSQWAMRLVIQSVSDVIPAKSVMGADISL